MSVPATTVLGLNFWNREYQQLKLCTTQSQILQASMAAKIIFVLNMNELGSDRFLKF